jgi:hypothetical protein
MAFTEHVRDVSERTTRNVFKDTGYVQLHDAYNTLTYVNPCITNYTSVYVIIELLDHLCNGSLILFV